MLLLLGQDARGPVRRRAEPAGRRRERGARVVFWACWAGVLGSLFGGALALRARYRAGDRERRRQVLWLAYGALLVPLWLGGTSLSRACSRRSPTPTCRC